MLEPSVVLPLLCVGAVLVAVLVCWVSWMVDQWIESILCVPEIGSLDRQDRTERLRAWSVLPDTAPVMTDVEIDHWAEVYRANPVIARRGVLFDTFLRAPADILRAVVYESPPLHRLAAADPTPAAIPAGRREPEGTAMHRGLGLIEPMRHRRHYRPRPSKAHNPKTLEQSR